MKCEYCGKAGAKGWTGGKAACELCLWRISKNIKINVKKKRGTPISKLRIAKI